LCSQTTVKQKHWANNWGAFCRCYVVAYAEDRKYAALAPFGGSAFIAAWASLLFWSLVNLKQFTDILMAHSADATSHVLKISNVHHLFHLEVFISMDQNFAHRIVPVSSLLPVIVSFPVWNSKYKECLLWLFIIECTQEHFLCCLWYLRFHHHRMGALLLLRQGVKRRSGCRLLWLLWHWCHLGHNALL
jgi:hypothetical protein